MFSFLKSIIKWIIFFVILLFLIFFLAKLVRKQDTVKKNLDSGVKVIKKASEDTVDKVEDVLEKNSGTQQTTTVDRNSSERTTQSTTTTQNTTTNNTTSNQIIPSASLVDAPDTASSPIIPTLFGTLLLTAGGLYIYKNNKEV